MRKYIISILLSMAVGAQGQIRWNQTYQEYFNQYKDIAIEQMQKYHIPASITLAQGVFESAAGRSRLVTIGNNHFGIKCNGWTGRKMYHDDDADDECFRVYDSAYESYNDHSRFLSGSNRYKGLFKLKITDYKGWARGLKAAGYATNPQYAHKLIEIIQLYKLYQYDTANEYDKFLAEHSKDHTDNGAPLHLVKMFNKNYYIIARRGDTFQSIADEMDISASRLAKFNERSKHDALEEGEVIWLKKKQKKAPKDYKDRLHYVRAGESMYSISQSYGIRLKFLYRMNDLSPNDDINVGDALRLR